MRSGVLFRAEGSGWQGYNEWTDDNSKRAGARIGWAVPTNARDALGGAHATACCGCCMQWSRIALVCLLLMAAGCAWDTPLRRRRDAALLRRDDLPRQEPRSGDLGVTASL